MRSKHVTTSTTAQTVTLTNATGDAAIRNLIVVNVDAGATAAVYFTYATDSGTLPVAVAAADDTAVACAGLPAVPMQIGPATSVKVSVIAAPPDVGHAAYKAYVFVRPANLKTGWDRNRILQEINARNVPCFTGSCSEIYLERAFVDRTLGPKEALPVARELGETSLMFLIHPTLTQQNLDQTIAVARSVFERACG